MWGYSESLLLTLFVKRDGENRKLRKICPVMTTSTDNSNSTRAQLNDFWPEDGVQVWQP